MEKKDNNCLHKINELARGSSVQAKASNQYWLALIVVAIASIIPSMSPETTITTSELTELPLELVLPVEQQVIPIHLPFGLGTVTVAHFYTVCLIILSGLCIAYTNAHIEVSRIKDEIEEIVEELRDFEQGQQPHLCDSRNIDDILNSCIVPNFNKVASIPLYFFPPSKWKKILANTETTKGTAWRWWFRKSSMYFVLKAVSWVFTYVIPGTALVICAIKGCKAMHWGLIAPAIFVSIIGLSALLAMLWVDIKWTRGKISKWKEPYLKRFEPEKLKEKVTAA